MPNRIIKESINESKGLSECSLFAQDLYKRLITYADDYGRFNGDLEIMRARLFPRELEEVTEDDILDGITELIGVGKISFYRGIDITERNQKIFGYFPKWAEHQRIRNTRAKCPDPEEEVNDWYLRRFVPIELKVEIYERDDFTCQECGKSYRLEGISTKRAIRLLNGALRVDHIVHVVQGGRSTEENLRVLCASCSQKLQRRYAVGDIVNFAATCGKSRQPAASREEPRPESNPIQSNPNPYIYTHDELEILEVWNSCKVTSHQQTEAMRKAIAKGLKKFGKDSLLTAIKNYSTVFADKQYFYKHKWRLDNFIDQKNGVPAFLPDGQIWINYEANRKPPERGGPKHR